MNIVIAGDGELGFYLARFLSADFHNITIVDPHKELLELLESNSDLMTIAGDSTSIDVLKSANIKKTDLLISVLHEETTNIVTAILAKKLGAKRTIARVNNTENLTDENRKVFHELGIDAIVSPESIAAIEIVKLLNQAAATEIFDFSKGKLSLFLIRLDSKAKVLDKTLDEIAVEYPELNFRAVALHRESKTIIPKGNDKFQLNDLAYVITKPDGIGHLMKLGGKSKIEIKDVMIIGGGRIGRISAHMMEKKFNIKLIDTNKERCENLANLLTDTLIINGDARDVDLLEDEGIRGIDAFIAVTNDSETNIFTCLLAQKMGVKKTIALVENLDYIDIAQNIGIDTIINKKMIAASDIVRHTMDAEVVSIKCLHGVEAEVLEFVVKAKSSVTKKSIRNLHFPPDAIIGGIVRGDESYIALGDFQIQKDDKVVVYALPTAIQKVVKLFS